MKNKKQFGKLIISKTNGQYDTYHDLDLIIIKGNRNQVSIDHDVSKIIIYGNNNKLNVSPSGNIDNLVLKGNSNIILAKYLYSISTKNYGLGNSLYMKSRESDNSQHDSNEEEEEYEEEKEKEEEMNIEDDHEIDDNLYESNENMNLEDEDDNIGDNSSVFSNIFLGAFNPFTSSIISFQNYDLHEERRNIFRAAVAELVLGRTNRCSHIDVNKVLNDLIDISFKNVSKGVKSGNEKCAVCYENFKDNENVKMTSCFHIFHYICIKKWIETKAESPDCPICRRKL